MNIVESMPGRAANVASIHMQYSIALPAFTTPAVAEPDYPIWSGADAPPFVGDTVDVKLNGLGRGQVLGYVVREGYLAVVVKLLAPPGWYTLQASGRGVAIIFGKEL